MLAAMPDLAIAAVSAFGVVFVAELGDKTQLLALGFGARHRLRTVAVGLAIGYGAASALAAVVGGVLGATLPERPIAVAAGLLFVGFAVLALRGEDDDDPEPVVRARGVIASIAMTIAIAEMGDKTQLATAALAARSNPVGAWLGATAGALGAGMTGAFVGQRIGGRVSAPALRIATAALLAAFGAALIVGAL